MWLVYIINEGFHIFVPILSLWNPMYILHLQHISLQTSHVSGAQ